MKKLRHQGREERDQGPKLHLLASEALNRSQWQVTNKDALN